MTNFYILQPHLSAVMNNMNFDEVIQLQMETMKAKLELPEDATATNTTLRKHKKDARELRNSKLSYEIDAAIERENAFTRVYKEIVEAKSRLRFRNAETTKNMIKSLPLDKG